MHARQLVGVGAAREAHAVQVLLRRVAAAMVHRALRRAVNSWADGAADRRAACAIDDSGAAGRLLLALRRWFLGVAAVARALAGEVAALLAEGKVTEAACRAQRRVRAFLDFVATKRFFG